MKRLPLLLLAACSSAPTSGVWLVPASPDAASDSRADASDAHVVWPDAEPDAEPDAGAEADAAEAAPDVYIEDAGSDADTLDVAQEPDAETLIDGCPIDMARVPGALCFDRWNARFDDVALLIAQNIPAPNPCADADLTQQATQWQWSIGTWCMAAHWCNQHGRHLCTMAEWETGCKASGNDVPIAELDIEWANPSHPAVGPPYSGNITIGCATWNQPWTGGNDYRRIRCCKDAQ